MKILILCGVFAKENEKEIVEKSTSPVEFSANLFQQRLINGFKLQAEHEISVLSAPFIGAYPTGSKTIFFKSFKEEQNEYKYVSFNNIWGIRNFSRTKSLKKAINGFANSEGEKLIVVYCTHTPFIKAAEYAKKIDPNIKICLYVPDLPQFMNLSENRGFIYNTAKKFDISSMTKHMGCVDSFVLLTEPMKDRLPVGCKPYTVIEGIFDKLPKKFSNVETKEKNIVYTGKLDTKFGIRSLVDAMEHLRDESLRLVLCGTGDAYEYAVEKSKTDKRICPMGQVLPEEAEMWRQKAAVLVNPRPNAEEYTKYSFPSKNVEYLLSGKPTVSYMLDGMPPNYADYIFEISSEEESGCAIAQAVEKALLAPEEENSKRFESYVKYAEEKLLAQNIAHKIIKLNLKRGK